MDTRDSRMICSRAGLITAGRTEKEIKSSSREERIFLPVNGGGEGRARLQTDYALASRCCRGQLSVVATLYSPRFAVRSAGSDDFSALRAITGEKPVPIVSAILEHGTVMNDRDNIVNTVLYDVSSQAGAIIVLEKKTPISSSTSIMG